MLVLLILESVIVAEVSPLGIVAVNRSPNFLFIHYSLFDLCNSELYSIYRLNCQQHNLNVHMSRTEPLEHGRIFLQSLPYLVVANTEQVFYNNHIAT